MQGTKVTPPARQRSLLAHWAGRLWLKLTGWSIEGGAPNVSHAVVVGAPHTSNWDLFYMLAITGVLRVRVNWLGKHTLFIPPFRYLLKALGGIPVDRRAASGAVRQAASQLQQPEPMLLAIAPSGTRSRRDHWKGGFYWIALRAKVPIVCGYLDYAKRQGGFSPPIHLTGDLEKDMDQVRAFFADKEGRHPDKKSRVYLRAEERASKDTDHAGPIEE